MFGGIKKTSYLCNRKQESNALVAQLVEHLTLNQGVQGSNPCRRTKREKEYFFSLFFCIVPSLKCHTDILKLNRFFIGVKEYDSYEMLTIASWKTKVC